MASSFVVDRAAEQRLQNYFDSIGGVLGLAARRASFATYAMGIVGGPVAVRPVVTIGELEALSLDEKTGMAGFACPALSTARPQAPGRDALQWVAR
jgi:hypothetical protein